MFPSLQTPSFGGPVSPQVKKGDKIDNGTGKILPFIYWVGTSLGRKCSQMQTIFLPILCALNSNILLSITEYLPCVAIMILIEGDTS